jgi:hypothetical protein
MKGIPDRPGQGGAQTLSRRAWLGAASLLALLWAITFWPVVFGHKNLMGYDRLDPRLTGAPLTLARHGGIRWPARGDTSLHMIFLPGKTFLASELHRGVFPLWNPRIACGQPVASDPQYQPFSPFFWPFLAWPSAWMFSMGIVCMALFGMLGFSLYFRELGWKWPAVLAGGALLTWNALTAQMLVLSSAWTLWSFGWALWGAERWMRGRCLGLPLCMAGSALVVYAGHPVIAALYVGILVAYVAVGPGARFPSQRAMFGTVGIAWIAALTAVVTLPFLVNLSLYDSYKTSWDGGPFNPWWFLSDPASTVYLPMPLFALVVPGLATRGDRRRWFFLALAGYGFLAMVPWFTSGPMRWLLSLGGNLVALYGQEALWLGTGWLAVRGLQVLAEREDRSRGRSIRCLLYGAAAYYVLGWFSSEYAFRSYLPFHHPTLAGMEVACLLGLVAATAMSQINARDLTFMATVLLLAALPLALPLGPSVLYSAADLSGDPPPVVKRILEECGAQGRWRMSAEYLRRADGLADLTPNQPEEWGLWDIRTTNPIILANFAGFSLKWHSNLHFIARWFPNQSDELLRFLGVRWVVQDEARPEEPGWGRRIPCPLVAREVDGPVPWARALGQWEAVASPERQMSATFRAIDSGAWRTMAILDRPAALVPRSGAGWSKPTLLWEEQGPNRWRWRLAGPSASLLVVLQNAHPNWSARVDGEKVPILSAYGTFQAVEVPSGQHEVEMRYDEPWFWRGAAVSALAWVGLLGIAVYGLRQRKGRSSS